MAQRIALRRVSLLALALFWIGAAGGPLHAQTIARCGEGWLEEIDGYPVLHLQGTPYEMGFQHGALLQGHIRENLHYLLEVKGAARVKLGPLSLSPRVAVESIVRHQRQFTPAKYFEEFEGLAAATQIPLKDIAAGNFIPEMFHCSGFAVMNSATEGGTLYHGRILDYATDWRLQQHAVLIVAAPAGGVPFVNISYAGFVGSVTGMNAEGVSIGEMGGGGLGHWDGVPMALLVREALETARDLDAAVAVFRDNKRTCQYFYVLADGKSNRAVGMEASWNKFTLLEPGEAHPLLPRPVKDAVLLSAGDRYEELARRAAAGHGHFDATTSLRLMDCPVAAKSNLHSVLFAPRTTDFWVANASPDGQPASTQPYQKFQLTELLKRKPGHRAKQIALTPREAQP